MHIKMKTGVAGEWTARKGHIVDRPFKEAISLINNGIAEVCDETSKEDIENMELQKQGKLPVSDLPKPSINHPEAAVLPGGRTKAILNKILKKN